MKPRFVLDAWAVLALLQGEEPAASRVKQLLEMGLQSEAELYISIISLGEVVYRVGKVKGEVQAYQTLGQIEHLPLTIVSASDEAVLVAADLKMRYAIPYTGSFAGGTAQYLGAVLVTADPELIALEDVIDVERLDRGEQA
jgi:predicted nucleic acid-binding protein